MPYQSPVNKIYQYFPIIEGVCLAAFAVGYLLKIMNYQGGPEIIILSLSALSGIYFLNGYIPPQQIKEEDPTAKPQPLGFVALFGRTIAPKILSIGSSVAVTGILFAIQHWNGFREMLLIGSNSIAASAVVGLITTMNDEQARKTIGPMLIRAIPLMIVGIYLLMKYGIASPTV